MVVCGRGCLLLLVASAETSPPPRELFAGFSVPDGLIPDGFQDQADSFQKMAMDKLAGGSDAAGIMSILSDSTSLLDKSTESTNAAESSFGALQTQLTNIFSSFSPLQPLFAKGNTGLMEILTSPSNMQALLHTVTQVLGTSDVLKTLSSAVASILDVLGKVKEVIFSAVSKLSGSAEGRRLLGERRLLDFTDLLQGMDFDGLISKMKGYAEQGTQLSDRLGNIQQVLQPVLDAVNGGRRLSFSDDQEKYAKAIKDVVPAWQAVEGVGIQVCPSISESKNFAASMKCRIQGFTGANGALDFVANMAGAGSDCQTPAKVEVGSGKCPEKGMSSGVENALGDNAGMIGYVLAAIAAVGGAGGVGLAALKSFTGGGDSDDDEDDEEQALQPVQ
mmetsp:Transcript_94742/g.253409  ORF Transcript_94742/g.253409 Transcript_94742/m.253409 type:complete len:390 (-) Transcript_94742:239-1408(-)